QFLWMRKYLGTAGLNLAPDAKPGSWPAVIALLAAVAIVVVLSVTGTIHLNAKALGAVCSWLIGVLAVGYFTYLAFFAGLTGVARQRVYVLVALFVGCAVFFAGFEQMGASLNLFAERYTERTVFGHTFGTEALQTVGPFFIIVFSPVMALVWLALGKRN